jgi:hypothetical protein
MANTPSNDVDQWELAMRVLRHPTTIATGLNIVAQWVEVEALASKFSALASALEGDTQRLATRLTNTTRRGDHLLAIWQGTLTKCEEELSTLLSRVTNAAIKELVLDAGDVHASVAARDHQNALGQELVLARTLVAELHTHQALLSRVISDRDSSAPSTGLTVKRWAVGALVILFGVLGTATVGGFFLFLAVFTFAGCVAACGYRTYYQRRVRAATTSSLEATRRTVIILIQEGKLTAKRMEDCAQDSRRLFVSTNALCNRAKRWETQPTTVEADVLKVVRVVAQLTS